MHNNTHYNNKHQPFAHQLRQAMTKAEACLWKYVLKAGKMKGYTFRRQRLVLDFIVGFMCIPSKLEIEVDGYSEACYEVIGFTDSQVLKNLQNVMVEIENNIEELERRNSSQHRKVHPQPPPAGDIAITKILVKKLSILLKIKREVTY